MAVITLAEYKTLAGITGTDQDARISAFIPLVEDDIIAICNYDFGQGTADEDFPDGMKIYATQMITYQLANAGKVATMQSESIDGYSYTRADSGASGYPATFENGLASKWRRASFKSPSAETTFRDRRGQSVKDIASRGPYYSTPGVPINE